MRKKASWAGEAAKLEREGWSRTQIALHFNVSKTMVTLVLGARMRDPSWAARERVIEVPGWVPAAMHDEYVAVAREADEHAAAAWARAEKKRRGAA